MRYMVLRILGTSFLALVVASGLSYGTTDYSQQSVTELIDDLTQIDSESVAINTSYLYGFIADETSASFRTNRFGVVFPDVPPQMRELVRRGPLALPELIKHLDDKRLTKLEVGGPPPSGSGGVWEGKFFGYAYSPRVRGSQPRLGQPPWTQKTFTTTYTLRVGDVCYGLIGQIVNRGLQVLQNLPSGFLVVNSPLEAPVLIEKVKNDWGNGDAEMVKTSLMADIHIADFAKEPNAQYIETAKNEALRRLRLYFPDAYNALSGDDLQRKIKFEASEHHSSIR
jgi:hypothetical protein